MGSKSGGFADLFRAHDNLTSDKWEHYLAVYETEVGPIVEIGEPVNILEIGVQNGGSLEIWHKYLPAGSRVVGVDIDQRCSDLKFPEQVTFIQANAAEPEICNILPDISFDIIIDDGSHVFEDIVASFGLLFDRLTLGGKYIIEDLETSYDSNYGGGLRSHRSSVEWAKGFIDALNVYHVAPDALVDAADGESLKRFGSRLWKMSFYDSVVVFHTLKSPKSRPFRRLFNGNTTQVMDPSEWPKHTPAEVFADIAFNETMYRRVNTALCDEVRQLHEREKETDRFLDGLRAQIDALKK